MRNARHSPLARSRGLRCGLLLFALTACEDTFPLAGLAPPPCTFDAAGGFCGSGACEIVVPPGALELPTTIFVDAEGAGDIGVDVVGDRLCRVGPADVVFTVPAELRMAIAEDEIAEGFDLFDLVGFTVGEDGELTRAASTDAQPTFRRIAIPVVGATRAGATIVPNDIELVDELGRVDLDITDAASYLRNLSAFPFRGVFFDGERLYVGNGPRVLVWEDGIPEHGLVPPDLVIGKRDLEDVSTIVDAANISGNVEDIWSDGERLVVSAGHRVLIWERRPTESGAPADLVLGQETFNTNDANLGGAPSAQTLFAPDELTSDGTRLMVADTANHRVLVWDTFPRLFGQPADRVIGQPAFDSNTLRAGAIPFYQPRGVYLDASRILVSSSLGCTCAFGLDADFENDNPLPDFTVGIENGVRRVTPTAFSQPSAMHAYGEGGLALRDASGARVSLWRTFPESDDQAPDLYVGKPDGRIGGTAVTGVNASSITAGASAMGGVFADEERLIVADETRVLVWRSLPEVSYEPADLVIGQPGSTTAEPAIDYGGIARDSLAHPHGLYGEGATIAIADRSNHRVVIRDEDQTVILGQADGESFLENRGDEARADTLSGPTDALLVAGRVVVVDSGNHRVLVWNTIPTTDGAPADHVIGQADFASNAPNRGRPDDDKDGDRDADADTLRGPTRAFAVGDRLYVADTENHRVLAYDAFATAQVATAVIGQADFEANDPNRGGGWYDRDADTFALPEGLYVDDGDLYVADRENNRVLVFFDVATTDDVADLVFGQPDFTSDAAPSIAAPPASNQGLPYNPPQLTASALTLRRPRDVRVLGGRVLVADGDNHRVLGYAPPYDAAPFEATLVIGQEDFEAHVANADGIGATSLQTPTALATRDDQLLVADAGNHRVLAFPVASLVDGTRPEAAEVFGQIDAIGHGINKSARSPGLLSNPTGVAHDGTHLWVVDRDHHRVVAYGEDGEPAFALGQPDLSRGLANAGDEPSASTLASPTDVYADAERLIVADRNNHRVLIWSPPPTHNAAPADVVIGQRSFETNVANAGRGIELAGPDGLSAPEGIDYADGKLYVADTGNSRVVVFEAPFTNASAATDVWCQTGFADNRSNRGRGAPDADTCAAPRDVTRVEDSLYIADTLNNRVLVTGLTGGPAHQVLGQRDFVTRLTQPVSDWAFASPVSVAYDGSNLLVSDSGHHRVLVYALLPDQNGAPADRVIGQRSFESPVPSPEASGLRSPGRVALVPLAFNDTRVYVADTQNNRIAVYRGLAALGALTGQ
ncbi:MAG: NHL repeat-containing protein [Deltaproteobacteria bacterium]|jgi:hypothetical protein